VQCPAVACGEGYECVEGVCKFIVGPLNDILTDVDSGVADDILIDEDSGATDDIPTGKDPGGTDQTDTDLCTDVSCDPGYQCEDGECVPTDPCFGIPFEGCCDDNVLTWCTSDQLMTLDCDMEGGVCGWEPFIGAYHCQGGGAEDPSGTFPLECHP